MGEPTRPFRTSSRRIALLGILVFAGCARISGCARALLSSDGGWAIERIEERWNTEDPKEDLVVFRNGKTWENLGMKAEYLTEIRGPKGARAFLFRALSCVECEPDVLLTVRATSGEAVVAEPFPGKLNAVEMETGVRDPEPFLAVRAFYGRCLDGSADESVVVEQIKLPEGKASRKALVPTESGIEVRKLGAMPKATTAWALGECREIRPIDRDVQ